jgi:hypothetical protein
MNEQVDKHGNSSKDIPPQNMHFAVCTCGKKILVVPDLAAMSKALENHLAEHEGADEQFLIEQVFAIASN